MVTTMAGTMTTTAGMTTTPETTTAMAGTTMTGTTTTMTIDGTVPSREPLPLSQLLPS